jgi:hypothetical protein
MASQKFSPFDIKQIFPYLVTCFISFSLFEPAVFQFIQEKIGQDNVVLQSYIFKTFNIAYTSLPLIVLLVIWWYKMVRAKHIAIGNLSLKFRHLIWIVFLTTIMAAVFLFGFELPFVGSVLTCLIAILAVLISIANYSDRPRTNARRFSVAIIVATSLVLVFAVAQTIRSVQTCPCPQNNYYLAFNSLEEFFTTKSASDSLLKSVRSIEKGFIQTQARFQLGADKKSDTGEGMWKAQLSFQNHLADMESLNREFTALGDINDTLHFNRRVAIVNAAHILVDHHKVERQEAESLLARNKFLFLFLYIRKYSILMTISLASLLLSLYGVFGKEKSTSENGEFSISVILGVYLLLVIGLFPKPDVRHIRLDAGFQYNHFNWFLPGYISMEVSKVAYIDPVRSQEQREDLAAKIEDLKNQLLALTTTVNEIKNQTEKSLQPNDLEALGDQINDHSDSSSELLRKLIKK